ncbi:p21-activated protein kinase-interacting protein 1-like, partial [Aphis craccivora]
DESDEEAVEVKDNTIIGISIPNKTQNIKSKLPMNDVHNNKRKLPASGVKSNKLKLIKKKKSLSNNWKVNLLNYSASKVRT